MSAWTKRKRRKMIRDIREHTQTLNDLIGRVWRSRALIAGASRWSASGWTWRNWSAKR